MAEVVGSCDIFSTATCLENIVSVHLKLRTVYESILAQIQVIFIHPLSDSVVSMVPDILIRLLILCPLFAAQPESISLLQIRFSKSVPTMKLNNGVQMPVLAFAANLWSSDVCKTATADAIIAGFRFIWSSAIVGADCQAAQVVAISESTVPRSDFFIAGTVDTGSCTGFQQCFEQTKRGAEDQYRILQEDVLDMLMLDYPPSSGDCDSIHGQWAAFEEFYPARARSIAVSNFDSDQLKCITSNSSAVVPSVNQLNFHVGHGGAEVASANANLKVAVQAYSPLGAGQVISNSICSEIGAKYGKSAAQVALRWIFQHDVAIATQSTSLAHLQEDVDIFDFTLSQADMQQLDSQST